MCSAFSELAAQSLKDVTEEDCVYGDCNDGRGTLQLKTPGVLASTLGTSEMESSMATVAWRYPYLLLSAPYMRELGARYQRKEGYPLER